MTNVDKWDAVVRFYRPNNFNAVANYISELKAAGTKIEVVYG